MNNTIDFNKFEFVWAVTSSLSFYVLIL